MDNGKGKRAVDAEAAAEQQPPVAKKTKPTPSDYDDEEDEDDTDVIPTDVDPECEWLRRPIFDVYSDTRVKVATVKIMALSFWQIRGSFYSEMDAPSDECMQFGFTLFDERGYLRKRFAKEGNACWGKEVTGTDDDLLPVIYIEEIKVSKYHRGRGLGTWIINQFIKSQDLAADLYMDSPPEFLFAWPTLLPDAENDDVRVHPLDQLTPAAEKARETLFEERRDRIVNFFRKTGFRRIGDSAFFCIARDAKHPSRKVTAAQDALVKQVTEKDPAAAAVTEAERNDAFQKLMGQFGVPGYP